MVHPNGTAAPNGTRSIYGLFWQLRGGQCNVHRDFGFQDGQTDKQMRQSIACDLLLEGGNVTKVMQPYGRAPKCSSDHYVGMYCSGGAHSSYGLLLVCQGPVLTSRSACKLWEGPCRGMRCGGG